MVLSSSWILSLKVICMSTGALTLAMFFKLSVPLLMDFSASRAPLLWSSFLSWLKPPYLYLVINVIIITIVASSRFYKNDEVSAQSSPRDVDYNEIKLKADFARVVHEQQQSQKVEVEEDREETKALVFVEKSVVVSPTVEAGCGDASWKLPKWMDSSEIASENELSGEKPPVSARFGHRKPVKGSPEGGRALRVTKPKRHETLENTWKTITEGRAMPLTRHLKKSDTWENHSRHVNVDPSPVKKSETFRDRTNYQLPPMSNNSPASSGKLRKEPSLSQDELNRRVEAFIKKFNEEMRLQRQESLKHYQEMISRGV